MEESSSCRVKNVHWWEMLLQVVASEEKDNDRTNATQLETMNYYLNNTQIRGILDDWLEKMHNTHSKKHNAEDSPLKCDEISQQWRQRGNEVYRKADGSLTDAYEYYQCSVAFAQPTGPMLPLALSNRSAVLARLRKFKECLSDIAWALELGCPKEMRHKLLMRRADCLAELGRERESRDALNQAILHADLQNLAPSATLEAKTLVKQIEQKLRTIRPVYRNPDVLPFLHLGPNENFASASRAVRLVRGDPSVGRYVVTRHKVSRGDVLFSEEPYAWVTLPGAGPVCATCCATNINIVPCNVCSRVGYCSFECRDRGHQLFHCWECVGYQSEIFHTIGIAHLALRVLLMMAYKGFPKPKSIKSKRELAKQNWSQAKSTDEAKCVDGQDGHIGHAEGQDNESGTSTHSQLNGAAPGESTGAIRKTTVAVNKNTRPSRPRERMYSGLIRGSDEAETSFCDSFPDSGDQNGILETPEDSPERVAELLDRYQRVDNVEIFKADYPPFWRMFSLVCNFDKMCNSDYIQYCLTAAMLTRYLEKFTTFFEYLPSRLPCRLSGANLRAFSAALLLRCMGQLICNGHAAINLAPPDKKYGRFSGEREVRHATCIYPSTAMMNHSCDPDVINNFYKNRLIIRCARDLMANASVNNCYGPHYARYPLETRQELLRAQYGFHCLCDLCSDRDKKDFAKVFSAFACLYCKAPLQSSAEICVHCRQPVSMSDRRDLLERADEISAAAEKCEKLSTMCEEEQNALRNRQRALHRHNTELREYTDSLARMHIECGQYGKAVELIKQNVQSAEYQFGSFSSEVANELRKLSDVMFKRINSPEYANSTNYRDWCLETLKVLRKAVTLMELNYGSWEPFVKRLQEQESQVAQELAAMNSPEDDHDVFESVHYNMHYNLKI